MYYQIVSQGTQALKTLDAWLDKAEKHAAAKNFDMEVLMTSRLAPDMQPLTYQVTSACDYLKGAAGWLSGQAPPKHEDFEKTIGEVRERLKKTIEFAESVKEDQFQGAADRKIRVSFGPEGKKFLTAEDYVLQMTIPNVYFHISMVYALLRHNGVDVGKLDFLGPIRWTTEN